MLVARWCNTKKAFESENQSDRIFRDALGMFGTGVTVITTDGKDGPVGMTANSFTSISLNPPLVMWSAASNSRRYPYFAASKNIAVHVLAADQQEICWSFANSMDAFATCDWEKNAHGTPLISGCLARFECEPYATHEAGDHVIVVLKVTDLSLTEGDPLLFHAGQVGGFVKGA